MFLRFLLIFTCSVVFVHCSPVSFKKDSQKNTCQYFGENCITQNGYDYFNYAILTPGGAVDILFVDDNSGSMTPEQQKISFAFPQFINQLDSRNLDYRIAITTTDISSSENPPRSINGNGSLQDGNLIPFTSGVLYLTQAITGRENLFRQTIQRHETINICDPFLRQNIDRNSNSYFTQYIQSCPSDDERGILAASMAISKNVGTFIRPEAHLAVIVISDENERSHASQDMMDFRPLEVGDYPDTLIQQVKQSSTGKTFAFHSIIVPSGDQNCLNQQKNQIPGVLSGSFGSMYQELSMKTGGIVGSICENTYDQRLAQIGAAIVQQTSRIKLACATPENITVNFIPQDPNNPFTMNQGELAFAKPIAPNTHINLTYQCKTL